MIKKNNAKLIEFHKKLASMKFFDPACGCGNFLAITYRELRLLELDILREIFKKQEDNKNINLSELIFLDVDQFYGVEIEEFPAQIAQVALWLVDHQMNMLISKEFGQYFARLPLRKSPHIICGDALRLEWASVITPNEFTYILSNPPFVGKQHQNEQQKADMVNIFSSVEGAGVLDLVSGWYMRAAQIMRKEPHIKAAFVSTNSITQGEQVAIIWQELMLKYNINIHFAHRTFQWGSDVSHGKAAVHCVIIGFANFESNKKIIFNYETPQSNPQAIEVNNINPYLVDAPNVFISNRKKPICHVPEIVFGSMPNDGGNLLLSNEEMQALIKKEPLSKKWIRIFMGADEFLNGIKKWCLWLQNITPEELRSLPNVSKRIIAVKQYRKNSKRAATQKLANFPTLFGEIRQPITNYILIPRVSSEKRKYIPIGFFPSNIIVGDTSLCIPSASLYHFGILTSLMHMAWVRAVCGRLESRYRYSCSLVYNNYPWPEANEKQKKVIEEAARRILEVRSKFTGSCLSDLYDPISMPPELTKAHQYLDRAVDFSYGQTDFQNEAERTAFLFERYKILTVVTQNAQKKYSVLDKKLILSSLIVDYLSESKGFGRTKFAKVFYLADMSCKQDLRTKYYREAAGPIDYDLLYSKSEKIEKIAKEKGYFLSKKMGRQINFSRGEKIHEIYGDVKYVFGDDFYVLEKILKLFEKLDTEQSEIVATVFACWNDLLIERAEVTEKLIINEVRNAWHISKKRFSEKRLANALAWMKKNLLIPKGLKGHTLVKKR